MDACLASRRLYLARALTPSHKTTPLSGLRPKLTRIGAKLVETWRHVYIYIVRTRWLPTGSDSSKYQSTTCSLLDLSSLAISISVIVPTSYSRSRGPTLFPTSSLNSLWPLPPSWSLGLVCDLFSCPLVIMPSLHRSVLRLTLLFY
jgi:hypothetical protein